MTAEAELISDLVVIGGGAAASTAGHKLRGGAGNDRTRGHPRRFLLLRAACSPKPPGCLAQSISATGRYSHYPGFGRFGDAGGMAGPSAV